MTRWTQHLAGLALAAAFTIGIPPAPASAQEAAPTEGAPGEASGRPLDGYIGTAVLAFLALFIVAKSARR